MALMWKDTTRTQTDCEKPLSRKKLRQLMSHNTHMLTARMLEAKHGRFTKATKKRIRETEAEQKRERELQLAGVPAGDRAPEPDPGGHTKTSIFKRMSGFFAGLRRKVERSNAKG